MSSHFLYIGISTSFSSKDIMEENDVETPTSNGGEDIFVTLVNKRRYFAHLLKIEYKH